MAKTPDRRWRSLPTLPYDKHKLGTAVECTFVINYRGVAHILDHKAQHIRLMRWDRALALSITAVPRKKKKNNFKKYNMDSLLVTCFYCAHMRTSTGDLTQALVLYLTHRVSARHTAHLKQYSMACFCSSLQQSSHYPVVYRLPYALSLFSPVDTAIKIK